MRSFEEEAALVGSRALIYTPGKERQLGYGTYLWDNIFLLDTGRKIPEARCFAMAAPPSPVPEFTITLMSDTRVFEERSGSLLNSGYYLYKGHKVRIVEIATRGWNHGRYVAGKFYYRREPYWFVMSEVELPEEPHLHAVA